MQTEPKEEVTDQDLYSQGLTARGKIKATEGDREKLDPSKKPQVPFSSCHVLNQAKNLRGKVNPVNSSSSVEFSRFFGPS
jgi:hypothetical protein